MIYHGIITGGPKHGGTMAKDTRRVDDTGGFYVYVSAKGPTPSGWRWIEKKDAPK